MDDFRVEQAQRLRRHQAFILDLDGVVYRGEQVLPGAREFVAWADANDRRVLFLSNNSFATVEEVTAKLARLGIPHPEGRTLTAGWAAAQAIARRFPGGRVFALAVPSVEQMLRDAGLQTVPMPDDTIGMAGKQARPDAVLVGLDRSLTYPRLRSAMRLIMAGVAFYAVNRDPRLPIEDGFEPGTGSIVVALEYASGLPALMIGKPAPEIVYQALQQLSVRADEALMIGDALDLDIVAGHAAGVETALVLSGLTDAEQAQEATGDRRPAYVFADLADLLAELA
ncbi:MAG TPA: HAD-IIA family hydrolase [Ktedonobacterales bacterium]|nr:HAD-IIA family hydrolase [Ktedonobacterales bacterium]